MLLQEANWWQLGKEHRLVRAASRLLFVRVQEGLHSGSLGRREAEQNERVSRARRRLAGSKVWRRLNRRPRGQSGRLQDRSRARHVRDLRRRSAHVTVLCRGEFVRDVGW